MNFVTLVREMRAAVIFGLGSDERELRAFQKNSEWMIGLPGSASEADALLIFGGDGTVHRHLRRLVELQLPVLVVPCGSGNDFARALGIRSVRDSVKAWERFVAGAGARRIDVGIIKELSPQGLKPLSEKQGDRSAEALRHPQDADALHHSQGTEGLRRPEDVEARHHSQGTEALRHPQDVEVLRRPEGDQAVSHPQGAQAVRHPEGVEALRHPQDDLGAVRRSNGTASISCAPSEDRGDSKSLPDPGLQASAIGLHEHYFCCVGGVGLDSEVARRANGLPRWLRGHGGYVVSLPPALFRFVALPMKISVASGANTFAPHSEKPTVLAAFANAPTYGGGMKIAPHAQMDDGKLDVCVISDIDKFKLFYLFPSVYFGKHLGMEEVEYLQTERLKIETEKPLAVYADGEYVCETPVEIRIAPAALPVIVQSSLTGF